MNELQIIKGVRCYVDKDNVAQLNLEDVARGLGFIQTQTKNSKEYVSIRWERVDGHLKSFGVDPSPTCGGRPEYIPEAYYGVTFGEIIEAVSTDKKGHPIL